MKLVNDTWYSAAEVGAALSPDLRLPMMTEFESRIAVAWLSENLSAWDRYAFNVRIGDTVETPADFLPAVAKALQESSQKRADIIGTRNDRAAVVEVKVRIPIGALGQALGYATIFQAENPQYRTIERIVVGGDAMLDVPALLEAHDVKMVLYRDLWLMLGSPSA